MQHGSARPCAVKYISDHGRRQADHGASSSARFRLVPGSVAPEASIVTPSSAPERLGGGDCRLLLALGFFEQRGFFARQPAAEIVKDEPLQIDFADADPRRQPDEIGQLLDRFLEAGQPQGDTREWRRRSLFAVR